jgi:PD-(D/E)XK endonuclease
MFPARAQALSTTAKGAGAEQAILLALMVAGKTVLKPVSTGLRYDLVMDNLGGTFTRVQCKTGVLKPGGGVVRFSHLQRGRAART